MSRKTKTTKKRSSRFVPAASSSAAANPSLMLGIAPPNPAPVPVYADKWVRRVYGAAISTQSAVKEVTFAPSAFNVPGKLFVDKLQVWNLGDNKDNSTGINATFKQGVFTDLGNDDVTAHDFGSANSLPGVSCKVPTGHAIAVDAGANPLVVVAPVFPDASTATKATFVCHLTCWIAV